MKPIYDRMKELGLENETWLHGPDGVVTAWVEVTPAMAGLWAARFNGRNRPETEGHTERMTRDQLSGDWHVTHQGIAFDEDNQMADGQHRCKAIAASGRPQKLLVTLGLTRRAVEVIDRMRVRTLAHALSIMGYAHSSHHTVALARAMMRGTSPQVPVPTDVELRKFIDANLEAITFADRAKLRQKGSVVVPAAVARAYYHTEPGRLERFIAVFTDQVRLEDMRPGDATARRLAKVCEGEKGRSSGHCRRVLYLKAQNAINLFLNGHDAGKLYEAEADLFPLPRDRQAGVPVKREAQAQEGRRPERAVAV